MKYIIFLSLICMGTTLCAMEKLKVSVGLLPPYTSEQYLEDYGIATEIVKAAMQEKGLEPILELNPWKRTLLMLQKGAVSAIYPITDQQASEKNFLLSDPIAMLQGVAFVRKGSCPELQNASSLHDLKGCSIGSVQGSVFAESLNREKIKWIGANNEQGLFQMLSHQRFDVAITDVQSGWHTIRKHLPNQINRFKHHTKVFYSFPLRFGVSKDAAHSSQLISAFNQGLAAIKSNGKMHEIQQKYNVVSINQSTSVRSAHHKACLFVIGDINDAGFNQMHYDGLVSVSRNHGIPIGFESVPYNDRSDMEDSMRRLVEEEKCGLIINADGYASTEVTLKYAKRSPTTDFVLIEGQAPKELPNIYTADFAQQEGSFVVGYLAGKVTRAKKVGFIGGVDIPVIYDFFKGFKNGMLLADSSKEVVESFISSYPDYSGFNNPDEGKKLADRLYARGIDIIYAVAGGSNLGIIQSARENNKYVIGVDSDQDYLAKGHVLTSMVKRFDIAVRKIVARWLNGELKLAKKITLDYRDGGVGITPMQYTRQIIGEKTLQEVQKLEEDIRNEKIRF